MPADHALLTSAECQRILDIAQRTARARGVKDVEIIIAASEEALTRFANNAIHQNVAERVRHASIRILEDHRTARASTNRLDDASIAAAVNEAVAIARSLKPDPFLLPLADPQPITPVERWFESTASCTPEQRAQVVADAIATVEANGQTAAGIYSTGSVAEAILNTSGLFAAHSETMATFSITALAPDSSGWAKASSPDREAFDPVGLARSASAKATLSRSPRELAPGDYTVILEPAAVLDLLGQMFADFSLTAIDDQRSFLTERIGTQLFGENITIDDVVYHPLQSGAPFDGEGVPRTRLALVENGVPKQVACSRPAATRHGVAPTGHGFPIPNEMGEAPMNIVVRGGEASLPELIAGTPHGILVTRSWYIREVDPYEKIMTGMTRDGTFLIEGGRLTQGLRNFRFNQSLIELLQNVEAMSREERSSGEESFDMVVPAMKVNGFHMNEVTRF